jgi:hypothetical protein
MLNQSCIQGRDNDGNDANNTICFFNDYKNRDTDCKDKIPEFEDPEDYKFSYVRVNFLGFRTGVCWCCSFAKTDFCTEPSFPQPNPWPLIFSTVIIFITIVVISVGCGVRRGKPEDVIGSEHDDGMIVMRNSLELSKFPQDPRRSRVSTLEEIVENSYGLILEEIRNFNGVDRHSFSFGKIHNNKTCHFSCMYCQFFAFLTNMTYVQF